MCVAGGSDILALSVVTSTASHANVPGVPEDLGGVGAADTGTFEHRVQRRGYDHAPLATTADVVASAWRESDQAGFGDVVVERDVRIFEESRQSGPSASDILEALLECPAQVACLREHPLFSEPASPTSLAPPARGGAR